MAAGKEKANAFKEIGQFPLNLTLPFCCFMPLPNFTKTLIFALTLEVKGRLNLSCHGDSNIGRSNFG